MRTKIGVMRHVGSPTVPHPFNIRPTNLAFFVWFASSEPGCVTALANQPIQNSAFFFCNQIYGSGCFFRPWTKFILVVSRRAPHPDYMKGDGLETGREIVQVRDGFSNLTSVVVGDVG